MSGVRTESEWVEALSEGSNFLDPELVRAKTNWWSSTEASWNNSIFGHGTASKIIVNAIENYKSSNT